jgi:hypothetical protein
MFVALALAVGGPAACHDSPDADGAGGPGRELPTVEETTARLAAWFTTKADPNGLQYTADEADCAAEAVVAAIGVARIEALRTEAANDVGGPDEGLDLLQQPPLAADEADEVFAAMTGCIDFAGQVAEVLAAGGRSPATARCMARRYVATEVPRDAIMSARTDPELMAEIRSALAEIETACTGS